MANIEITDEYLEKLRQQFSQWKTFLNMGTGFVSFTLALACLGTHTPALNATFSMAVVVCIRIYGAGLFPEEITRLRQQAKQDLKAKIVLNGILKEFMGVRSLVLGYSIFLMGYLLLAFIMVSWLMTWFLEPKLPAVSAAIRSYVYGA